MIVADAYKQTMLADWVSPLYRRVVLAGDMHYLSEFKAVFTLTPIIMQELASRSAPFSLSLLPNMFVFSSLFPLYHVSSVFVTDVQCFIPPKVCVFLSLLCNTMLLFSPQSYYIY